MEPQRTFSVCVYSTLQHARVSADAGVLSTLNKREAPRQTRAARGAAPLRCALPSLLSHDHAPRHALDPYQRILGVVATADRAVESPLADREELLQAGHAHVVRAGELRRVLSHEHAL